jgi:hypothetical protein
MSSLAATQADGYYVPPEYYESGQYKKKSRNQFAGSKGHNQYLQNGVVRFELPEQGVCTGCGAHVGKGTRFNAHKEKSGNYFSTPIYKFTLKCRICAKAEFVIQTNPKERGFDYLEGIHKQVQEFDTKEAGTAGVIDTEHGNKLISTSGNSGDASRLARLESVASGARKTMTEHDQLTSLIEVSAETFLNDSASNAAVRSTFRVDRKNKKRRLKDATALGWKDGMELLPETADDQMAARATCFREGKYVEREKFRSLKKSSIFDTASKRGSRRRHSQSHARPDSVESLSHGKKADTTRIKQANDQEKRRIRLATNGSKLAIENAPVSTKVKEEQSSSLAALMADYESDSD